MNQPSTEMNSRERVVRAINHDYPDRPPISHAILPSAILRHGQALQDILKDVHEDFGWDLLPDVQPGNYPPYYRKGRSRDPFGTLWESSEDGEYGMPVELPLADWADYESYQWPEFEIKPAVARMYSGHMAGTSGDYHARGAWIQFFEDVFHALGSEKGGIIACGEVGSDTPIDNIKAMYETFMTFRF